MNNLLTQPLIRTAPGEAMSLPGVLAALSRDEIDSFPALRPHQAPAWHMFLVQLAALALHRAGRDYLPRDEVEWRSLLRTLTTNFPEDEPWRLAVADWAKPAFLQSPVPGSVKLENKLFSPDALDLLITSKNHDLKQAVARRGAAEDWVFALVSLQTGEGYGGAGNQGIARMNGGSSSRSTIALAPVSSSSAKTMSPRPGAWFSRDVRVLIAARERTLATNDHLGFPPKEGIGLVWLEPWPEGEQLQLVQLDLWFIEICRRIRLFEERGDFAAVKGTSAAARINAKHCKGAVGDPYAPVHKTESKSLTLGEGDFDYHRLTELLFSGDWELPLLARPADFEKPCSRLALVCAALSRGNSKTDGFKSRVIPVGNHAAALFGSRRQELHQLAKTQIEEIDDFAKTIRFALALAAAGGERDKIKKEHYALAISARTQFDRSADSVFFLHLWDRFEAQDSGEEALVAAQRAFQEALRARAEQIFFAALPSMPCAGIFRPRAEARAQSAFRAMICKSFPLLFETRVSGDSEVGAHAS
ncbi:hypothetical protein KKP04_14810 [Rhodomicrobium sp. Az07]|uniref:hypothetical protein n=1 Tax=Rhodomicrobium sp. Az07 TaxID=2839034 RepID=UPI001BEC227D|nr:hypothetical protein [Rhodomicrobium sp. Az07]MBT3072124.1 hypothetical protein [Rhodomicrobium sp. Az07]